MFLRRGEQITPLFVICLLLIFSQFALAGDPEWREVTPGELSMTKPSVEADADAEAIFWEVRINDSSQTQLSLEHYVRVKIFSERGREKYSKIDIPYTKRMKIKNIAARVIKPDGSIVDLSEDDVYEREIIKTNDEKVKAKSFAVPNIDTGVILEYQYREIVKRGIADNMPLIFQRDIPIQKSTYYVKPSRDVGQGMKYLAFNTGDAKFIKDKGGYYVAEMNNVPALKEEVYMPPEDEIRAWMMIYYDEYFAKTSGDFWSRFGGTLASAFDIKDVLKTSKTEKQMAQEIIGNANTDDEKIARLFEFCRTKIKNYSYDTSLTEEQLDEIKTNKSPKDTLKNMAGRSGEINELFAALASAAEFEARIAFTGNRNQIFFSQRHAHPSFVHPAAIAVQINNRWKFFDPGTPFVPYGMLAWFEEDQIAFLLDNKTYVRTKTPISEADQSVAKRKGKFTLSEDGTLEGTVEIEYTGHLAYRHKASNYEESENKREETLKEDLKERMSTAEISNISVLVNLEDSEKPFVYKYKVKVPNYAQKTGKRLFFQPGFFEYGRNPTFTSDERNYGVYFRFPWAEKDEIEINLPEGYTLDNAQSPGTVADPQNIGKVEIDIGVDKDGKTLVYKRNFHFGKGGVYYFTAEAYKPLKTLFDAFHKSDTYPITLKKQD